MGIGRVYGRDTDAIFLRLLRAMPDLVARFACKAGLGEERGAYDIRGQVRHAACSGSVDIVVRYRRGPILLIENKIDAYYSVTKAGEGQPQRYQRSVRAFKEAGAEAASVLLAPASYLAGSRLAGLFDARISYEEVCSHVSADDRAVLQAAIAQAATPYEPVANAGAGEFFADARAWMVAHYPTLVMKRNPNPDGVRPDDSRTIYFDVRRTLRAHAAVPRPRMSLQCWDKAALSASVKIMLPGAARLAPRLSVPSNLTDVGGYLRPASGSLGITIDTPRLDTQCPVSDQVDDLIEALEAALRLQKWWNENGDVLRQWAGKPL